MQRLQVLCFVHRPRSLLPTHRFGWTPPAPPQMTFCHLRSLRLPRSSLFLPFWSVASLLTLLRRPSYQFSPPPQLPIPPNFWMWPRRLFHTPLPSGTFLHNTRSGRFWLHPSTLDVHCPACARPFPSKLLDAAAQTPLHSVTTHVASTQLPLTDFLIRCILSNDPLDRQALPSAHCNAGSASPPQPPDIATLCSPSSASHASDGHEHTTAPHVLLATTGSREV